MRIARWSFLAVLFLGAVSPLVRNYDFLNDAHIVLVLLLVGTNLIFVPKNERTWCVCCWEPERPESQICCSCLSG